MSDNISIHNNKKIVNILPPHTSSEFLSFFFFLNLMHKSESALNFTILQHLFTLKFELVYWSSLALPVLVLKWFPYSCVIISCSVHFFLFFPLLTAWSLEETLFPQKKKSDSRLQRQKATTARMGLWDELPNRQVGLFVSDYSKRDVSATGKFKSFWKDLQHLCGVCLVRKKRNFFVCFLCRAVDWWADFFFPPNDVFILYKAIDAVSLFDVEEDVLLCRSAACALLGLEGALQPLQRGALMLRPAVITLTDASSRTAQPKFGEKKKKKLSRNVKMG